MSSIKEEEINVVLDTNVISCEIPSNAEPGDIFHVKAPDGRYFEVSVPEGGSPGETINVVIPEILGTNLSDDVTNVEDQVPIKPKSNEPNEYLKPNTLGGFGGIFNKIMTDVDKAGGISVGTNKVINQVKKSTKEMYVKAKDSYSKIDKDSIQGSTLKLIHDIDAHLNISKECWRVCGIITTYAKEIDEKYVITSSISHFAKKGTKQNIQDSIDYSKTKLNQGIDVVAGSISNLKVGGTTSDNNEKADIRV